MIETFNQAAGLAYAVTSNCPPGFLQRMRAVASTTAYAVPESLKESWDSIKNAKRRGVAKVMLGGITTAQVLGDDALFMGVHRVLKQSTDGGVLVPWVATAAIAAAGQAGLATANKKYLAPDFIKSDHKRVNNTKNHMQAVQGQVGKVGVSLFALGVPGHAVSANLSTREVVAHSALWGASAPAWYEAINVGLGPLDSTLAPFGVGTAMVGMRYVNEVCGRAAWQAKFRADLPESNRMKLATGIFSREGDITSWINEHLIPSPVSMNEIPMQYSELPELEMPSVA